MKTFVIFFLVAATILSQSLSFPQDTVVAEDRFNGRQTIMLDKNNKGKIFSEPNIVINDTLIDFGAVPVLIYPSDFDLWIHNTGDTTLRITNYQLSTMDFSVRLDAAEFIAAHDSGMTNLVFFPLTPGPKLDTLRVYSNDPQDSVITIIMRGYGEGQPAISVSKDSMFLHYSTGWYTRDSFFVKNTGYDTLRVDTLHASGGLEWYLYIDPTSVPVIPPGDSTMIYVELLIPVTEAPPVFIDTLFIHSNDPLRPVSNIIIKYEEPESVKDQLLPMEYSLDQNFPNPFNPETVIHFSLREAGPVILEIFNSTGEKVSTLVNGTLPAGRHSARFDAATLSSGVYLYRLNAGQFTSTRKMILLR